MVKRTREGSLEYDGAAVSSSAGVGAETSTSDAISAETSKTADRRVRPQSLTLAELREMTNDFSEDQLLGEGGFGKVYKGVLQNGDIMAVKKLKWTMTGIQDKQYENEVCHLMRLQHPNIVQLVGYCSETEKELVLHNGKYVYAEKPERLLCLEYLPKGNLGKYISDESSGLDWGTRYKIIEGICYGLHYLHIEWQADAGPIIHMDLKPENMLLDDNMSPKITDFGLSRLFGEEQTRTTTQNVNGTLGYMAPEYLNRGIITKELDIFSLGVIIIQIVTGHKDYPYNDETSCNFIELVLNKWRRNRLATKFNCQQIRKCMEIGLLCVKLERAERPTTGHIIEMLASGDVPIAHGVPLTGAALRPEGTGISGNSDIESFKRLLRGLAEKVSWQSDAASALAAVVVQCRSGMGMRPSINTRGDMWLLFVGPDQAGKRKMMNALSELMTNTKPVIVKFGGDSLLGKGCNGLNASFWAKASLDWVIQIVRQNPFSVIVLEGIDQVDTVVRGKIKRAMDWSPYRLHGL